MKRCPACKSTYTDDSLQFCLQDGEPLVGAEMDEQETVLRPGISDAVTIAVESEPETELLTKTSVPFDPAEPVRGSRTFLTILLTVLTMLVLFSVIGIAGFLYLGRDNTDVAGRANKNKDGSISGPRNEETKLPTATPSTTSDETSKPTVEPTPTKPEATPAPDQTVIRQAVYERVSNWAKLAEARDLGQYMDFYANRVDYYRRNKATKAFVRIDKQRAFSKYSKIRVRLSGLTVVPSDDGETAEAVFDKEWLFSDGTKDQTGKVRSRLVFRNVGGVWKIVSEKDVKVYYVNK